MTPSAPYSPANEHESGLVQRLMQGDVAALEQLYRDEADGVYRFAVALCGNADWAADVTQDAFIAFAAQPHLFDATRASVGAYLAGAARHALLALWRRSRKELPLEGEQDDDAASAGVAEPEHRGESPDSLLHRAQTEQALWTALRSLPWPFREALVLVDLQGRPYLEAAQIAGIELNTLRTRVHRARQRLAAVLNAMGTQAGDLS